MFAPFHHPRLSGSRSVSLLSSVRRRSVHLRKENNLLMFFFVFIAILLCPHQQKREPEEKDVKADSTTALRHREKENCVVSVTGYTSTESRRRIQHTIAVRLSKCGEIDADSFLVLLCKETLKRASTPTRPVDRTRGLGSPLRSLRFFFEKRGSSRVVTIFIYSLVFFFSCFLDFVNNASLCCFIAPRFDSL